VASKQKAKVRSRTKIILSGFFMPVASSDSRPAFCGFCSLYWQEFTSY
jgi:hypothetical protein